MARPKASATVVVDGVIYNAPKPAVVDYLFARMSGETHATAKKHLETGGTILHPSFSLSVNPSPADLATALKSMVVSTRTE